MKKAGWLIVLFVAILLFSLSIYSFSGYAVRKVNSSQTQYHLNCVSNTCNLVMGPGSNNCSTVGAYCGPPRHLDCVNYTCQYVPGSGSDLCALNVPCGFSPSFPTSPTTCTYSWGPEIRITNDTNFSEKPQIVYDHNGYIHMVWNDIRLYNLSSGIPTTTSRLMYTKLSGDGQTIIPPREIAVGNRNPDPSITFYRLRNKIDIDSSNNIHIVWNGFFNNTGGNILKYTKLDQYGNILLNLNLTNNNFSFMGRDIAGDDKDIFISVDSLNRANILFLNRSIAYWVGGIDPNIFYFRISPFGSIISSMLKASNYSQNNSNPQGINFFPVSLIADAYGINYIYSKNDWQLYGISNRTYYFERYDGYFSSPMPIYGPFSFEFYTDFQDILLKSSYGLYHVFGTNKSYYYYPTYSESYSNILFYTQISLLSIWIPPRVISNTSVGVYKADAIIENFTTGSDIVHLFWPDWRDYSTIYPNNYHRNSEIYYTQIDSNTGLNLINDVRLSTLSNFTYNNNQSYYPSAASSPETSRIAVAWEDSFRQTWSPISSEILLRIYSCR